MRLDVTSAKMRKRLVAELSAQPAGHGAQPNATHDSAASRPEAVKPKVLHGEPRLVKWAQAALSVLLGLRLPLDGVLGATTQMAVRRFQAQAGLPQSGSLDEATVAGLAKAIGHPPPGATAEHRLMPRWFRLERQAPRAKAPPVPQKQSPGPDAAPPMPHLELAKPLGKAEPAPEPAQPDVAPQKKKLRSEELP